MERKDSFTVGGDRYLFDFGTCSCANGFAQIDTDQDASYYGNWINPAERRVVIFAEGDNSILDFDNDTEMVAWIQRFKDNHSLGFIGIDPGLGKTLRLECIAHGLAPFIH